MTTHDHPRHPRPPTTTHDHTSPPITAHHRPLSPTKNHRPFHVVCTDVPLAALPCDVRVSGFFPDDITEPLNNYNAINGVYILQLGQSFNGLPVYRHDFLGIETMFGKRTTYLVHFDLEADDPNLTDPRWGIFLVPNPDPKVCMEMSMEMIERLWWKGDGGGSDGVLMDDG